MSTIRRASVLTAAALLGAGLVAAGTQSAQADVPAAARAGLVADEQPLPLPDPCDVIPLPVGCPVPTEVPPTTTAAPTGLPTVTVTATVEPPPVDPPPGETAEPTGGNTSTRTPGQTRTRSNSAPTGTIGTRPVAVEGNVGQQACSVFCAGSYEEAAGTSSSDPGARATNGADVAAADTFLPRTGSRTASTLTLAGVLLLAGALALGTRQRLTPAYRRRH